ncbi:iron-containing alcohol dehydrogenase [Psittacicella gerlachiana]|uniref:Uncharacterized protein n=1 Tax=Psittacicella gerlachiana TaxID=2028574 RepID=A0A3A1YIB4_9GAMM|nr:iron-containing alcohol dehydrogenase [Psittacicella gerlachiana]RIY36780.1 hypothetical protein CKF59_02295 [Psittacicella gerlachiana]
MNNFEFFNPTRVLFGQEQLKQLGRLIPEKATVMLVYGQGSVKHLGILDQVIEQLNHHKIKTIEFGGIKTNPDVSQLVEAIYVARKNHVNYLLAIGGGSVIDATKFISGHINIDQFDILLFDVYKDYFEVAEQEIIFAPQNKEFKNTPTPFGVILTCPGTGSEMNKWAVISDQYRNLKVDMGCESFFPQFTIIDPSFTLSLSKHQIQNGVVDAIMHVFEQYLLDYEACKDNELSCYFAESILRILWHYGPLTVNNPQDYKARANFCWAATNALNGYIGVGLQDEDWSTHQLGHMLTAFYGIEHAPSLAATFISSLRERFIYKKIRLARFAREVLKCRLTNTEKAAHYAIEQIANFFTNMQIPISLKDYGLEEDKQIIERIYQSMEEQNHKGFGEFQKVKRITITNIIKKQPLTISTPHSLVIKSKLRVSFKIVKFKEFYKENKKDKEVNATKNKPKKTLKPKLKPKAKSRIHIKPIAKDIIFLKERAVQQVQKKSKQTIVLTEEATPSFSPVNSTEKLKAKTILSKKVSSKSKTKHTSKLK